MQTQELKLTIVDTQRFYMKMIHEYIDTGIWKL